MPVFCLLKVEVELDGFVGVLQLSLSREEKYGVDPTHKSVGPTDPSKGLRNRSHGFTRAMPI